MSQISAARRRSAELADLGLAGLFFVWVAFVATQIEPGADDRAVDGLAYGCFGVASAALVMRRRRPLATVAVVTAGLAVYLARGYPGGPVYLALFLALYSTAMSFVGTFLFVVFVGAVAADFSRGTFRTMLLHQPGRVRLLAGKMAALLLFAAVALAAVEVLVWVAARVLASSQGVDASAWMAAGAVGDALGAYASVLFWVTGYAVLGMALAVVVRSVPVALAVGIAWAGPFEHLTQDAWSSAGRFFPGLLLEAFVTGGTPDVSVSRAFSTVAFYVVAAALASGVSVARRDVTT